MYSWLIPAGCDTAGGVTVLPCGSMFVVVGVAVCPVLAPCDTPCDPAATLSTGLTAVVVAVDTGVLILVGTDICGAKTVVLVGAAAGALAVHTGSQAGRNDSPLGLLQPITFISIPDGASHPLPMLGVIVAVLAPDSRIGRMVFALRRIYHP